MDKNRVKLAMAPIGWTNDDMPDLGAENTFEQCVSEMALAGYSGSEVGNKYPSNHEILKPMLDIRGIKICNQWFSSFLASKPFVEVEKEFIQQLKFLKAMGADVIGPSEQTRSCQGNVNQSVFSGKAELTTEEFNFLCKGMNKLGDIANGEGIKLAFHHHMGTGVQTMDEVDRFLNDTDPEKVHLLYDSGHFAFSEENPVSALNKYISRVGHVHLKDLRDNVFAEVKKKDYSFLDAVRAGVFTVPGDGNIDFPAIFKILEDKNYKGWMVVEAEQDPTKANPFEYAKNAREYIRVQTGL